MNYTVESTVKIGTNVTIQPYAVIKGNSVIGDNSVIGSGSYIEDSVIGDNTTIKHSYIVNSKVGNDCTVGPFAHLRNNSIVQDNCRVGNFVEIKNSTLGQHSKASHLAYIGDALIGKGCNIGCGVIFVNFDGKHKHMSTVGNNSFIGCNSNIIAPVNIGNNCFVACGTNVNVDIESNAFAIGRSELIVKQDYAKKYIDIDIN